MTIRQWGMMTMNRPLTALALSLALLVPAGAANPADRVPATAQEQLVSHTGAGLRVLCPQRGAARSRVLWPQRRNS